jgi:putative NADPH-quinone reductase
MTLREPMNPRRPGSRVTGKENTSAMRAGKRGRTAMAGPEVEVKITPSGKCRKILIIQGHPDPKARHFCHALATAYAKGACAAGHELRTIEIATLDFPYLRSLGEWNETPLPAGLCGAQSAIAWADHLVLVFPLWLGTMPAILKAFLEQVMRPGFALIYKGHRFPQKGLIGKSARVVVTMGMPAFWYRWFFRAHGVRGLERNILGFCGVAPIGETLIGLVESKAGNLHRKWLARLEKLGRNSG